jgi:Domain of unknown function (DUF4143)
MQMLWLKRLQKELLGQVFQSSIFSELIKQFGVEGVTYWRTADKKEIDFVLKRPEGPLPVEVKLHFPRMVPPVFSSFWQKESRGVDRPFFLVGLYGKPVGR